MTVARLIGCHGRGGNSGRASQRTCSQIVPLHGRPTIETNFFASKTRSADIGRLVVLASMRMDLGASHRSIELTHW